MNPRLLSFLVAAVAYGVTLTFAVLLLPGMHISFWWALLAWALFTVSITIIRPVVRFFIKVFTKKPEDGAKSRHGVTLLAGLVTVFLALLLTQHLAPGHSFRIDNWWTWLLATAIVWVGTAIYDLVDDRLVDRARPMADRAAASLTERKK
ncbi:MAG: phage holin family protein [Promicromonosporaceae bacterium]|nr:phage holin family protein [Promicromonosporaceae bacterium]